MKLPRIISFIFLLSCAPSELITDIKVVNHDRGGPLNKRSVEISSLGGTKVMILGTCFSTCTMYLGLDDVCVSPRASLGFHGPSLSGVPLDPESFEVASTFMADHYPEPIRDWYLKGPRHSLKPVYLTGEELISLGVKECLKQ